MDTEKKISTKKHLAFYGGISSIIGLALTVFFSLQSSSHEERQQNTQNIINTGEINQLVTTGNGNKIIAPKIEGYQNTFIAPTGENNPITINQAPPDYHTNKDDEITIFDLGESKSITIESKPPEAMKGVTCQVDLKANLMELTKNPKDSCSFELSTPPLPKPIYGEFDPAYLSIKITKDNYTIDTIERVLSVNNTLRLSTYKSSRILKNDTPINFKIGANSPENRLPKGCKCILSFEKKSINIRLDESDPSACSGTIFMKPLAQIRREDRFLYSMISSNQNYHESVLFHTECNGEPLDHAMTSIDFYIRY